MRNYQHDTGSSLKSIIRKSLFLQIWCTDEGPDYAETSLEDSHSPGKYRVLGPLSNSPEFAVIWNCPPNSTMNPSNRCIIWWQSASTLLQVQLRPYQCRLRTWENYCYHKAWMMVIVILFYSSEKLNTLPGIIWSVQHSWLTANLYGTYQNMKSSSEQYQKVSRQ
jgi:hypothetical protein